MVDQELAGFDDVPKSQVFPTFTLRIPMPRGVKPPAVAESYKLRAYREFLGLTQTALAAKLDRSPDRLAEWESGASPVPFMDLAHVRQIVAGQVREETQRLFKSLKPDLNRSDFDGIFSTPDADIRFDSQGNLYLGLVFIEGYRKHTLQMRLDDQKWYGIDEDGNATIVDEAFLDSIIESGKSRLS